MLAERYYEGILEILSRIRETQRQAMAQAAHRIATSLMQGGLLHLFGSGHSHCLAEEGFFRSGGLAPISPVFDPTLMLHEGVGKVVRLERLEGYAPLALVPYDLRPGEVMMIFSASGKNAAPIDICLEAKNRGLFTIAVTALAYSRTVPPQHPSGKKLYEIADLAIDNCCPFGDAVVQADGVPGIGRVGAASTIAGAFIWHTIEAQVIERYLAAGREPPMAQCFNTGEAAAQQHNQAVFAEYRQRIRHL